jgi:hypothetical protein
MSWINHHFHQFMHFVTIILDNKKLAEDIKLGYLRFVYSLFN